VMWFHALLLPRLKRVEVLVLMAEAVLLKLDHLSEKVIDTRLPGIRNIAIKFANVDPSDFTYPCCANCALHDGRYSN
jgi:succinate dehydrogenase/fumarate reductase flavoprotein subunit